MESTERIPGTVAVFGGTGFLGHRVVASLLRQGHAVRAVSRNPARVAKLFSQPARAVPQAAAMPAPEAVQADILEPGSVAAAVAGAGAVVNAVSLYVEEGARTFERVHVAAAAELAGAARRAGAVRFVQLSGIGADPGSESPYIRARGRGEAAVRQAFPGAAIARPSVMTGPDDAFLVPLERLLRKLPVLPMFGRGRTRLQPVHVEDVAEAVARLAAGGDSPASGPIELAMPDLATFEFGGPQVFTYRELLQAIARQAGARTLLVPLPFAAWHLLAGIAERLPGAPLTRNQVDLMRRDNVPGMGMPGLEELGIRPRDILAPDPGRD